MIRGACSWRSESTSSRILQDLAGAGRWGRINPPAARPFFCQGAGVPAQETPMGTFLKRFDTPARTGLTATAAGW